MNAFTPQMPRPLAPINSMSTGFFSIAEAAAMTKTGAETLRRAIRAGRLPAYGSRGRLRVRLSDLLPVYVPKRMQAHEAR